MDLHIFRTASDVAFFQYLLETTESVRIRIFCAPNLDWPQNSPMLKTRIVLRTMIFGAGMLAVLMLMCAGMPIQYVTREIGVKMVIRMSASVDSRQRLKVKLAVKTK